MVICNLLFIHVSYLSDCSSHPPRPFYWWKSFICLSTWWNTYIYSCEPTTLSIHQSVLSFGTACISVCLIIHPIILYTYYLPIYLSILLPLRPSIYPFQFFPTYCIFLKEMVLFRWNVSSVPGDLTRLHSRRHNGCRTILVQKRRHHQHSLWNRSRQVLWQPTSIYKKGRLYDHRDFWMAAIGVTKKTHFWCGLLEIHVSDIDSFWFFEKIDLHTACLRYLSICISSVSQSANKTSPNKDFQQIMESYSYMCHPKLVLTALRTSSNKTTPGLCQRKSFPTANRLIQYHCLFAWFGPSNFGVVYIEAQICRGLNHIKRRFTNFATFDLSAMRGTEKCVTLWVLAEGREVWRERVHLPVLFHIPWSPKKGLTTIITTNK